MNRELIDYICAECGSIEHLTVDQDPYCHRCKKPMMYYDSEKGEIILSTKRHNSDFEPPRFYFDETTTIVEALNQMGYQDENLKKARPDIILQFGKKSYLKLIYDKNAKMVFEPS